MLNIDNNWQFMYPVDTKQHQFSEYTTNDWKEYSDFVPLNVGGKTVQFILVSSQRDWKSSDLRRVVKENSSIIHSLFNISVLDFRHFLLWTAQHLTKKKYVNIKKTVLSNLEWFKLQRMKPLKCL